MARKTSATDHRTVLAILGQAKKLATKYWNLTGKPLGVTGEVAEFEAARLLHLKLAGAREPGFDAVERNTGRKLQIKGRRLRAGGKRGQRVGAINMKQKDWDAVVLVILNEDFSPDKIYEASRTSVLRALSERRLGVRPRNDMSVEKFRSIGALRWPKAGSVRVSQMPESAGSPARRTPRGDPR